MELGELLTEPCKKSTTKDTRKTQRTQLSEPCEKPS